jgi:hypothetical protein
MLRSDWFERQLEIIVAAVAAALGLKKKGETPAAVARLEADLGKAFGMSPRLALGLPLADFLKLAGRGEAPTPELLNGLADAFACWAELLGDGGRAAEAALARQRAEELRKWDCC